MEFCRLDNLPVELVHYLLSYFSAHEIFYTFTNVSAYIDAVLVAYSNYKINFKSISRSNFNLICETIKPDQVMSLTLSDDEHTPGLVELFLSRFQINQFTHLQSLKLIEIGPDHWENIITKLIELKNLRSLIYSSANRNHTWSCNLSGNDVTQLDIRLFGSYAPVLPQLQRLRLNHADFLTSVQFPYLRHLELGRCADDRLRHICSVAPNLKSLNTSLTKYDSSTTMIYPLPKLTRLVLQVDGSRISMNNIEEMMSCLPCLRHLELVARCDNDVVDGQRWQMKVKNLLTFRIRLRLSTESEAKHLDSFRSLFWVEEKQWFVAYLQRSLFSVPYFNEKYSSEELELPVYSTVPDSKIFYESIKELAPSDLRTEKYEYFPNVETLTIVSDMRIPAIEKVTSLSGVQKLICNVSTDDFQLTTLINLMPNLHYISSAQNMEEFLKQVGCVTLEKIRTLKIGESFEHTGKYDFKKLQTIFPNIEHLHLTISYSNTIAEMVNSLNYFEHLSSAGFQYTEWSWDEEDAEQNRSNIQSELDQIRHDQRLNYTYRFDCVSFYIWIS